jgi:hypothetical protein
MLEPPRYRFALGGRAGLKCAEWIRRGKPRVRISIFLLLGLDQFFLRAETNPACA